MKSFEISKINGKGGKRNKQGGNYKETFREIEVLEEKKMVESKVKNINAGRNGGEGKDSEKTQKNRKIRNGRGEADENGRIYTQVENVHKLGESNQSRQEE